MHHRLAAAPTTTPLAAAPARKCSLGCPVLDSFLQGGIPCGSITELVGECGSGKTQLCLQLLLAAQLPVSHGGLQASSLYLYTENYFPFRRLQHLAQSLVFSGKLRGQKKYSPAEYESDSLITDGVEGRDPPTSSKYSPAPVCANNLKEYFEGVDPCDNVFVQGIQTIEQLLAVLEQAYLLLTQPLTMPVRLIVIDSIAALFRSDFDNTAKDLTKRADWFFKIASKLKLYAHRFNLAVVVTNHVVDFVQSEDATAQKRFDGVQLGNSEALYSSGRRVVPALGISWAQCVNMRLFLSRSLETNLQTSAREASASATHPDFEKVCHNRETSGKPAGEDFISGKTKEPHSALLQQLETDLPDWILLKLSEGQGSINEHLQELKRLEKDTDYACMEFPEVAAGHVGFQDPASSTSMTVCQDSNLGFRRTMQIVYAPHLPLMSCEFAVERDMIRGISFDREIYPLLEATKMR